MSDTNSTRLRESWLSNYLNVDVARDIYLEIELLTLAFATGIMDVVTFPDYHIFTSNQTGNTIFLAVGALNLADGIVDLRHVGLSLGVFLIGAIVFGQIGNRVGRIKRFWLLISTAFQTIICFVAAGLQSYTDSHYDEPYIMGIISLLAFASGAQAALGRSVSIPEVPTVVVTSAYVDLIVDPHLLAAHNRPRNRRILFVLSILAGGFIGAVAYRYSSPALALYIASAVKTLVVALVLIHPSADAGNTTGHA